MIIPFALIIQFDKNKDIQCMVNGVYKNMVNGTSKRIEHKIMIDYNSHYNTITLSKDDWDTISKSLSRIANVSTTNINSIKQTHVN
jgi:hypothetical protein